MKGRAMKNRFLILSLLFPFVSLALSNDDFKEPSVLRVYSFTSFTSAANFQTSFSTVNLSGSDPYFSFASLPFGLAFGNSGSISVPSQNLTTLTNSAFDIKFPIRSQPTNSSSVVYLSPYLFPRISSLFRFVVNLYFSGYRGPGVSVVSSSSTQTAANFNFPLIVSDVMSSTNTVFRSLILQHLNSINASLSSIDSTLSSLGSSVVSISNSINPDPFQVDFVSAVQTLRSTSSLGSIDYDGIIQEYNDLPSSAARSLYARGFSRFFDMREGAQGLAGGLAGSLEDMRTIGNAFNGSVNEALTGSSSGSGGGGIAGDIKRLSTNDWASVVTNQLAQGTRDTKRQFRDNHDSITNRLAHMFDDTPNSAGRAIRQTADNTAVSAARASDIASRLNGVLHVQVDNPNNIGVVLDGPVTIDTTQFNGVSVPLAGVKDKIDTWYNDWYSFFDISTPSLSWSSYYNTVRDFKDQNHSDLSAITNSLRGVFSVTGDVSRIYDYLSGSQSNLLEVIANSITNNWDDYYFKRFRRANEFSDEDDQPFTLEGASRTVFGRGFDEGEYSRLNWFSRVELLLFQLSAVSSGTNALESVDIEDDLNDTVDSFNQHGQDFVNASRRVVGVFQLIDGFAASMRSAFGGYSNPVTSGIVLLPAGSWIFDNALVLEVPVVIQNALRLVFQCIWYLSAFVVAWRVVVATWSRVVSFVRWLWSVFDI